MTPEDRSREYAPEEWSVGGGEIRVLLLEPVEYTENWPVLVEYESALTRGLRIARNGILLALCVAACYGLIAGITWGAWKVLS